MTHYIDKVLGTLGENGEHWCKGYLATDKYGKPVPVFDPEAYRFCLLGAFLKLGLDRTEICSKLGKTNFNSLMQVNDKTRTFEELKDFLEGCKDEKYICKDYDW